VIGLTNKSLATGKSRNIDPTSTCLFFLMTKENDGRPIPGGYVQILAKLRIETLFRFFRSTLGIITPPAQFGSNELYCSFDEWTCWSLRYPAATDFASSARRPHLHK
jgi:hypothetical protein